MVVAEEFGEWTDGQRRIDLLGIDKEANLVVIELKRTIDGGHMDLQALRYAAMVSTMTFARLVEIYTEYAGIDSQSDAEEALLNFLGWDEASEEDFGGDVRVVLASGEFSKELTTSVLWLNDRGLDIRCIRMKPYKTNDGILVNIDQVIPLPEAEEFQVSVREKRQRQQRERVSNRDATRRDLIVDGKSFSALPKRRIIFEVVSSALEKGADIDDIRKAMPNNKWMCVQGELTSEEFIESAIQLKESLGSVFRPRKYFTDDEDLFHINGNTYSLSNQWGKGTQDHVTRLNDNYDLGVEIVW